MKHFSEEELIAYQLHESSDEGPVSQHLESCSECADLSESIAETLRVFSADPVPQPNLEHNWQRLRGNLGVLTPERSRGFEFLRWGWAAWPAAGLATAALILPTVFGLHIHRTDSLAEVYRTTTDPKVKSSIISAMFITKDAPRMVEMARSEKNLS